MANATGDAKSGPLRLGFDSSVQLLFRGSAISSDGGLLLHRELDDALGLTDLASGLLADHRTGNNGRHTFVGLLRQSVFSRLAGYEDVNDADRLCRDPVMRQLIGGRAVKSGAASASAMGRFETLSLTQPENWPASPANGSMRSMPSVRRRSSAWIWTALRAQFMATRKARCGTGISNRSACTRCSCSTSSAIWSVVSCVLATCTAV